MEEIRLNRFVEAVLAAAALTLLGAGCSAPTAEQETAAKPEREEARQTTSALTDSVTCTTKRRVVNPDGVTCTQTTTIESPYFWLTWDAFNDPEGAVTTNSPGIVELYNTYAGNPIFFKTDDTHTLYLGEYWTAQPDQVQRSGSTGTVLVNGRRFGFIPSPDPSCQIPRIDVVCSGTTTLPPP